MPAGLFFVAGLPFPGRTRHPEKVTDRPYSRHLIIDGYNVVHQWPELKTHLRGGAVARERLVEAVRMIHDVEAVRVTVVFDGAGQDIEIERPGEDLTFSVVYSPAGMSADAVIERMVEVAESREAIHVVTRDNLERETVQAMGAFALDPDGLRDWILRCDRKLARDLHRRRAGVERQWRRRE